MTRLLFDLVLLTCMALWAWVAWLWGSYRHSWRVKVVNAGVIATTCVILVALNWPTIVDDWHHADEMIPLSQATGAVVLLIGLLGLLIPVLVWHAQKRHRSDRAA